MKHTVKRSLIWKLPAIEFELLVKQSKTIAEICFAFGIARASGNYNTIWRRINDDRIDASHIPRGLGSNFGRKFVVEQVPLETVLVENSTYSRASLKKRLIKNGILENKCSKCGQLPEWNGEKLVMVLDHINGIRDDNRIENLRLVCPNCNSQLDTFTGRNNKLTKNCLTRNCQDCGLRLDGKKNFCKKCVLVRKSQCVSKVCPTKEVLEKLLWMMPSTAIGKQFGVSGKSVEKWAIKYGLSKPPRGYWSKQKTKCKRSEQV